MSRAPHRTPKGQFCSPLEKPDRPPTLALANRDGEDGPDERAANKPVERIVLTAEQVAEMLGASVEWVSTRGKSGTDGFPRSFALSPGCRTKPMIRFRRDEVLDYVDRCQGLTSRRP